MLTFYPEFESISDPDPEIIILLDMSNSMKGKPEEDAKKVTYINTQHFLSVSFITVRNHVIFYTYIRTKVIRLFVIISLILSKFFIQQRADTSSLFVANHYLRAVSMYAVFFHTFKVV